MNNSAPANDSNLNPAMTDINSNVSSNAGLSAQAANQPIAEGAATSGAMGSTPANNNQQQPIMNQTMNRDYMISMLEQYAGDLLVDSTGSHETNVVRYPVMPNEFTIDNFVAPTLRREFRFIPGLSEFTPPRIIRPAGIFAAYVAMKVEFNRENPVWDTSYPLPPSIISAILEKKKENKEGDKYEGRRPFGNEGTLLRMQPHAFLSTPFAHITEETPDGFDYDRGVYVPDFTKERRQAVLIDAANIVIASEVKEEKRFTQEIVLLARQVIKDGPESLSYEGNNSPQKKLLAATRLLDNICEIFFAHAFKSDLTANPDLADRMDASRSGLADRFNKIAYHHGEINSGEYALFCIVGFANRLFITKSTNEDKYTHTQRIRTFTDPLDLTWPTGFFVGVQKLESSQKLADKSLYQDGTCNSKFKQMRMNGKGSVANLPIAVVPEMIRMMEQESAASYAESKKAVAATAATPAPAANSDKGEISNSSRMSKKTGKTAVNNAVATGSVVKAEVAQTGIKIDRNDRAGRILLVHAACLQALGVEQHDVIRIVNSAKAKVAAANAKKDAKGIKIALREMDESANSYYAADVKRIDAFLDDYDKAVDTNVDLALNLANLEAALQTGKKDAILTYIKQVCVTLFMFYTQKGEEFAEDKEIAGELLGKFFSEDTEDAFFNDIKTTGQTPAQAAMKTFAYLQMHRNEAASESSKKTVGAFVDEKLAFVFGNSSYKQWREDQMQAVDRRIEKAIAGRTPAAAAVASTQAAPAPVATPPATSAELPTAPVAADTLPENIVPTRNRLQRAASNRNKGDLGVSVGGDDILNGCQQ